MKKLKNTFLLSLWLSAGFAQIPSLVYDKSEDSTYQISDLKLVNGKIQFTGGDTENIPKGIAFCGNGGPRIFIEKHIFELETQTGTTEKIFHHNLKNQFIYDENQKIPDTSVIFRSSFYPLSDSTGIYLPNKQNHFIWTKKGELYEKLKLPGKWKRLSIVRGEYDFANKFLVELGGSQTIDNTVFTKSRLAYITRDSLKLNSFLPDSFEFETYYYDSYKDKIIFNGRSIASKEKALFISDCNGNIKKITHFPKGMVFVELMEIMNNKLLVEVTHRGKKGSYNNKDFEATELWEYDLENNTSERIIDFGRYALVNSPIIFSNTFLCVAGLKDYDLWYYKNKADYGLLNEYIKVEQGTRLVPFREALYFIDKFGFLIKIDSSLKIERIKGDYLLAQNLSVVDSILIFTATENDSTRNVYKLNQSDNSAEKIEGLSAYCPTKQHYRFGLKKIESNVFKITSDLYGKKYALYRLKNSDYFELIADNINLITTISKDELYFLKKKNSKFFNQIWKVKI